MSNMNGAQMNNGQQTTAMVQHQKPKPMAFGQTGIVIRNFDDLQRLAQSFAASGYFRDVADVAKAIVKIQYGAELGLSPMASMLGIHIIEGKPSLSAGAIAARIKQTGRAGTAAESFPKYRYKVERQDSKGCVLAWFEDGDALGKSSFVEEDARNAGLLGKKNWQAWPQSMYFARALTLGARTHCPDVFFGPVYTAEELAPDTVDMDQDGNVVSINPQQQMSAADPAASTRGGMAKLREQAARATTEVVVEQAAGLPVTVLVDKPTADDVMDAEIAKGATIIDAAFTASAAVRAGEAAPSAAMGATAGEAAPAVEPAKAKRGKAKADAPSTEKTPTDAGAGSVATSQPVVDQTPSAATTSAPTATATPATSSPTARIINVQTGEVVDAATGEVLEREPGSDDDVGDESGGEDPFAVADAPTLPLVAEACARMPKQQDKLAKYGMEWKAKLPAEDFPLMQQYGRAVFNIARGFEVTAGMKPNEVELYRKAATLAAEYAKANNVVIENGAA